MSHEHSHQHSHAINAESLNKAFIIGIVLNLAFVVIEFAAGFWFDSLALLSDAGHNLSDVVSLVLALLAFRLAKVKANERYTYGYKKSTILVSLLNAVILLVAVGAIVIESIHKLNNPAVVPGGLFHTDTHRLFKTFPSHESLFRGKYPIDLQVYQK